MSENFANNFSTVLTGPLTAAATTLAVASSTGAPPPNFRIAIDQEILLVTAVAGTSWTVARGQENTTAAAHLQGALVQAELTAGGLANLPYVAAPTGAAVAGQVLTAVGSPPVPTWAASSGTIAAATRTALSATADASLPDGQPAFNEEVVGKALYRANWLLDKLSTLTADGVTVLATNSGTGRWILKSRLAGTVPVTEVGADPTGSVDSLAAVNAAAAALSGTGVALYFPGGTYQLSAMPTIPTNMKVEIAASASFTGTGGTAFAAAYGLTTYTQSGSLTGTINPTIPIKVVPLDPVRGQYGLWLLGNQNEDATIDTTWHFGYNWDGAVQTEPKAAFSIEDNWVTGSPAVPAVEMHVQCYLPVLASVVRPLSAYLRRDTGDVSVTHETNGAGIWSVVEHTSGKIMLEASDAARGIVVGDQSYALNTAIYGGVIGLNAGEWILHDNGGSLRYQTCTGLSDQFMLGTVGAEFFKATNAGGIQCGAPLGGGVGGTPLQTKSVSIALSHGGTTTLTGAQSANPTILLTDAGLTGNAAVVLPTTTGPTEWTVDLTGVTFSSHTVTLQVGTATKTVVVSAASVVRIYSDGVGKLYAWTAS